MIKFKNSVFFIFAISIGLLFFSSIDKLIAEELVIPELPSKEQNLPQEKYLSKEDAASSLSQKKTSPQSPVMSSEKTSIDTSRLISLDVKDVDIKDVLRLFSHTSDLNIIVGDDVRVKVTLRLTDVDWEEALSMVLKTYNLTSVKQSNFLRIMTYEKFWEESEKAPLTDKVVFLNFVDADEIIDVLQTLMSTRGRIVSNNKTNSLVIRDTKDVMDRIDDVIKKLDKPTQQVMIEALIVDVKLSDEEQLGINWKVVTKEGTSLERSIAGNLAAGRTEGIIRYGKAIMDGTTFTTLIDIWCQQRKAEVLANPKIMTLNGVKANIELVEKIPFVQSTISGSTGSITSTVSFQDAGIKLDVTPNINEDKFVSLHIKTEQSFRTGTIANQPIIDSRTAETDLLVKDGETIVIGGLRKRETTKTKDSVPVLGKIPLLGALFKKNVSTSTDSELLIFVTPSIVSQRELTVEEKRSVERVKALESLNAEEQKLSEDIKEEQQIKQKDMDQRIEGDSVLPPLREAPNKETINNNKEIKQEEKKDTVPERQYKESQNPESSKTDNVIDKRQDKVKEWLDRGNQKK